jgi:hypothetical protein
MAALRDYVKFEGVHCTLTIRRPRPGTVVAIFQGRDVGEFGEAAFRELDKDLQEYAPINFFVDGRQTLAASLDVSSHWAQWMRDHREKIRRLDILCGSRFLQFTAEFVRRFSGFEDRMRIYTDPEAFEAELAAVVRNAESLAKQAP